MNQAGTTAWINTPLHTLYERLSAQKTKRPLIRELSDQQLQGFIGKKFAGRKIYYEQADVTIDEELLLLDSLIEKIFHA